MTNEFTVSSVSAEEIAEVPAEILPLNMQMQTLSFGGESTWEITNLDEVLCSGGPYTSDTFFEITDCQLAGGDYTLRCIDSYGDGWHGGYVTINGIIYCEDLTGSTGEEPGRLMIKAFTV